MHLLLNKEDDTLIVVSNESFAHVFATDNTFVEIEYTTQLQANAIPFKRVIAAFAEYFRTQGYQRTLDINTDFDPNDLETRQKAETVVIRRAK